MATYQIFITKLRTELKDFGKIRKDVWDGDGSTKNFVASQIPIKDDSYTVKVGGVTKVENTDYSLDKDTGVLTFVSAPASGSDNVEMAYQSIKIRDADYIEMINDGIDHFRWKFWKEAIDTSSITTVKDQYEYSLSTLTGILWIRQVSYKDSAAATVWKAVSGLTNWKWYPRQIKWYVNPPFDSAGLPLKFLYLKSLIKGTIASATIDIPDEWILPFKYYVYARYYERLIPEKIHETAAITTQPSYSPAQVVFNIAEMYYRKAEEVANKIAPKLPAYAIRQNQEGVME